MMYFPFKIRLKDAIVRKRYFGFKYFRNRYINNVMTVRKMVRCDGSKYQAEMSKYRYKFLSNDFWFRNRKFSIFRHSIYGIYDIPISIHRQYHGYTNDGEMSEADYEEMYNKSMRQHNLIAYNNIITQRRLK